MKAEEIAVIYNPAARGERAERVREKIRNLPHGKLMATASAGDATTLAARAVEQGFRTIVAAGGDGTVNDVVNGIARTDVTLGVLPVGTMNVFAAELGIPGDLRKAWSVIEAGHTRRIDLGRANKQFFVQLAGVGLDAQVVAATSWASKKSLGPLSYLISAAQIAAQPPPRLRIESEDREIDGSFVLIGNGRFYGGPLAFFKDAKIDDGKLDVLVFKNLGYLDLARYVSMMLVGRHTDLRDVEYFQTRRAVVRSESEVPVEVDGEVMARVPVTFRISARKLRVLVPAGSLAR